MTHACSCQHGSSKDPDATFVPVRAEQTVGEIVERNPATLEVMQRMGINHCCGAGLSLREAAASVGRPLEALISALDEAGRAVTSCRAATR